MYVYDEREGELSYFNDAIGYKSGKCIGPNASDRWKQYEHTCEALVVDWYDRSTTCSERNLCQWMSLLQARVKDD